jgi:hypothetical protein
MTPINANGVKCGNNDGIVVMLVMANWLRLAAAPTFTIMALLTVVLDNRLPNALCLATGGLRLGGMAPMYALMAVFHSAPWLNLISHRRNSPRHS